MVVVVVMVVGGRQGGREEGTDGVAEEQSPYFVTPLSFSGHSCWFCYQERFFLLLSFLSFFSK